VTFFKKRGVFSWLGPITWTWRKLWTLNWFSVSNCKTVLFLKSLN